MISDRWLQAKDIFNSALDLDPGERRDYLDAACNGDTELRLRVEDLLNSYESEFLEGPVPAKGSSKKGRLEGGTKLGRFEIVRLISVGGMGEVYLARDDQLGRKVAVKVLNEKYERDEANLQRFVQEAKAASALNHPNILTIFEIGETDSSHFIVSEFVEGHTLRTLLNERKLPLSDVLGISIQVAEALCAAHKARIIHRDIKPENIIVRNDGYVKVVDFGLAKLMPSQPSFVGLDDETIRQNQTAQGIILGTVNYMSPEQAKGEAVDDRTDIFSLGVVIYEMIAGRMPFAANSVSERIANLINKEPEHLSRLVPGVSKELESIVSKALQKDRNDRYISMRELLADLRNARVEVVRVPSVSESEQRTIKLEPRSTEQARWRYSPMAVLAAILIIGLAVAGAAGLVANWYRNSETPPKAVGGLNRSPAYDLYMRGKVKAGSENREEIEGAIKVLEEAVTIDRNYAEPYAALAVAYNTKAFQFAPASEKKQISENAEIAVEKALRLDPNSAEAHFARGVVLWTHNKRFPHEQAIRAFKRALAIDPNHDEARHRLSMVYSHIGLLDEAQTELKKALELNPNNTLARFRAAVFYYYQGKYEEALATLKTVPGDVSPALASRTTADTLSHLGRNAEAAAIVEEYLRSYPQDEGGNVTSVKAILLAKDQKYKEAQESIDRAIEIGRGFGHFHHTAFNIASAYAIMKRTDDAMKWLQDAADDGFPCYSFFAIDPNLDNLRQDRQFIDFMEKGKARMETFRRQIY